MHSHSASLRSVRYVLLMHARVAALTPVYPFSDSFKKLSEKGASNAPTANWPGLRTRNGLSLKTLLGVPQGLIAGVYKTFRIVALGR